MMSRSGPAHGRRRMLGGVALLVAVVVLGWAGFVASGPRDAAARNDLPDAGVVPDPADVMRRTLLVTGPDGKALAGGGGETIFTVQLEGEDECPGDSAQDQYRVDSYMLGSHRDPTELGFTGLGPVPLRFQSRADFQMPLFRVSGDPFAADLTAQKATPDGPGPIRELADFAFSVYVPTPGVEGYGGGLPAGEYRIGIACTFAGQITNLWETTIEVAGDPLDEPVGISWRVTGPQPRSLEVSRSASRLPAIGLGVLGVALAGIAVRLNRASRTARPREASP